MRAATGFLIFFALMGIAAGLAYLLVPLQMTAPMEFGALTPPALADVRANYGGLQLGLGVFLLYCVRTAQIRMGLLMVLLTMLFLPLCRAISFALDGGATPVLQAILAFEVILLVITLVLYRRIAA